MKGKLLYKSTADALQILVRLVGKDTQRSSLYVVVDKGLPACNGGLDRLVRLRAAACMHSPSYEKASLVLAQCQL